MAGGQIGLINKLQKGINANGGKIIINHTQFYSEQRKGAVGMYTIKQAYWNPEKERTESYEIYSSYSQLQTLLFLRDYWNKMNGWEIPTDNIEWNEAKERYYAKHPEIQEKDRV